jgi:hypothetical protein
MPVRYERNDAQRRVVVTVQGAFQTSDMLAVIERHRSEDAWGYGILYDLRHLAGDATVPELREILKQAASRPTEGRRGPVALLVTDPILYRLACTYAALGRTTVTVQVFRDSDEADLWLAGETSAGT